MLKILKGASLVFMLIAVGVIAEAQNYQVTFAINGNADLPDSVLVKNVDRDIELVLQNGDVLYLEDATTDVRNNASLNQQLRVYPNPVGAGVTTVEFYNATQGLVSVEAYSTDGKRILCRNENIQQGYNSYALSGLSKGVYVIQIRTPESNSAAVVISNSNTSEKPEIKWLDVHNNTTDFSQMKAASNNQSTVNMPYSKGESLKFTAFLSRFTSIEEHEIANDTIIEFNFIPYAGFVADKTSAEVGDVISFTDNSINNATSWLWNFGDDKSSTLQTPTHSYDEVGTYTVSLTASNSAGDSTISKLDYIVIAEKGEVDYPSDVISFFDEWKITLGDGSEEKDLIDYEHTDYFYSTHDGSRNWVVYKTPNSGGTTANSSNTRSELRHLPEWTPETGGKLTGTCKVMHVSTTADARVPASFSVVVGQIHSSEGHENEPIKIYYKKFPGHTKGSVFWNYEINTEGDDNGGRWDYSTAIWGDDWSTVGATADTYPNEPTDGIELGEEFSYVINVFEGIMYLTFTSEGHDTVRFTKSLIETEYEAYEDIPQQVLDVFSSTGQDGTERSNAYAGELQYFKQGAYNQTNGKDPADNMVWNTGAETYEGDLSDQYANGSYTEVWFKNASVGAGTDPATE